MKDEVDGYERNVVIKYVNKTANNSNWNERANDEARVAIWQSVVWVPALSAEWSYNRMQNTHFLFDSNCEQKPRKRENCDAMSIIESAIRLAEWRRNCAFDWMPCNRLLFEFIQIRMLLHWMSHSCARTSNKSQSEAYLFRSISPRLNGPHNGSHLHRFERQNKHEFVINCDPWADARYSRTGRGGEAKEAGVEKQFIRWRASEENLKARERANEKDLHITAQRRGISTSLLLKLWCW